MIAESTVHTLVTLLPIEKNLSAACVLQTGRDPLLFPFFFSFLFILL